MGHTNIEIKARTSKQDEIRKILKKHNAEYIGTDSQINVYFNVKNGRLKLRKGIIENYLIYYDRINQEGPKQSDIVLYKSNLESALEQILTKALGILIVVDKKREIYFIDNVKIHLDKVKGLKKDFVEIEAIDSEGDIGKKRLLKQCRYYMKLLGIEQKDLIDCSYSDMFLREDKNDMD
ncbi:adenylate cyclase [Candidatus Pacearchaeota archaeon RBG_19FT_COMBO_34_9]|nr:MAG: adenylate cyclase [Candidatus Pacearchaeota archaeon RBG_19FT_COMBO_34_9]OGJ16999.1 MAG: adenylate cyclase [Candidatus Pacearchaeota archaeon RBG_13_33_26]